jgi:hypothetical protein
MQTIYIDRKDIPANLINGLGGNKFKVEVTESVTLRDTYWDGGTKSSYGVVNLATGERQPIAQNSAPSFFGIDFDGQTIQLKPGFAVLEHSIFCGKDHGYTFYLHADNAVLFLPAPTDTLSRAELCLLAATSGLKSSYDGRKPRIDMMHNNGFSDSDIAAATESLKAKKMLNAAGAITTSGKNACPERSQFRQW